MHATSTLNRELTRLSINAITAGQSYIKHIESSAVDELVKAGLFSAAVS